MNAFLKGFSGAPIFPIVYVKFSSRHGANALLNYRPLPIVILTVRIINIHQSDIHLPNDNRRDFHKHPLKVNKKYRVYAILCGNKVPTRCNRWYLLQILLHAQHVSGNTMPIIRSSRVLYRWSLPHNLQLHITPTTWKPKHQIPQAATICIILSSSWWWA